MEIKIREIWKLSLQFLTDFKTKRNVKESNR